MKICHLSHDSFRQADRRETGTLTDGSKTDFCQGSVSQVDLLYGSARYHWGDGDLYFVTRTDDDRSVKNTLTTIQDDTAHAERVVVYFKQTFRRLAVVVFE